MLSKILIALTLVTTTGIISANETTDQTQPPAANTVNPMDWMKMMPMMANQQNISSLNLAKPQGWTVFMNPNNLAAFMNPATYGQFMNPQFYMQFANPNNMMAWMNPAAYGEFMNPNAYMQWMNPASYTAPAKGTTTAFNWFDAKAWMQVPSQPSDTQAQQ